MRPQAFQSCPSRYFTFCCATIFFLSFSKLVFTLIGQGHPSFDGPIVQLRHVPRLRIMRQHGLSCVDLFSFFLTVLACIWTGRTGIVWKGEGGKQGQNRTRKGREERRLRGREFVGSYLGGRLANAPSFAQYDARHENTTNRQHRRKRFRICCFQRIRGPRHRRSAYAPVWPGKGPGEGRVYTHLLADGLCTSCIESSARLDLRRAERGRAEEG